MGAPLRCVQKVGQVSEEKPPDIIECTENDTPLQMLDDGEAQVAGGTAWMWAREQYEGTVDVLFVDEAGQMPTVAAMTNPRPCNYP